MHTVEEFKDPRYEIRSPESKIGQCPNCGGEIIKGKKDYGCSNWRKADGACRFVIRSNISGRMITPPLISALLATKQVGPLEGFVSEDGEPFTGIIKLVREGDVWRVGQPEVSDSPPRRSPNALGECPACGGEVTDGNKSYGCSNWKDMDGGCRFNIWKTIAGKEITPQIAEELLQKGEAGPFDDFMSRAGKPFSTSLKVLQKDGAWKVGFDFPERTVIGKCPVCGGDVVENPKAYGCVNWRESDGSCKFTIWKVVARKELSVKIATHLLENGITDPLFGFISRNGNAFSARLRLQADETGLLKVVFDFPDNHP